MPINAALSLSGLSFHGIDKVKKALAMTWSARFGRRRRASDNAVCRRIGGYRRPTGRWSDQLATRQCDLEFSTGKLTWARCLMSCPRGPEGNFLAYRRIRAFGRFSGPIPGGLPTLDAFPFRAEFEMRPLSMGLGNKYVSVKDLSD